MVGEGGVESWKEKLGVEEGKRGDSGREVKGGV